MKHLLALVLVTCLPACGKKGEPTATTSVGSGSATGQGSSVASGSAAGSATGSSGSALASGSAAGSATGSSGSALAEDPDANPRMSQICTEVITKILECAKDPKFLEALDEGVDAKRKANDKKYLKQIVEWHYDTCNSLPTAIQEEGFLRDDRWPDVLNAVQNARALENCGYLGTALNSSGLFGGDVSN